MRELVILKHFVDVGRRDGYRDVVLPSFALRVDVPSRGYFGGGLADNGAASGSSRWGCRPASHFNLRAQMWAY